MNRKSRSPNPRYRITSLSFALIVLTVISLLVSGQAQAQGSTNLTSGSVVTGTLSDQTRLVLYSFGGKAGDLITAEVIGTSPGMNPTVSLLAPGQQQIGSNSGDPYGPAGLTTARVSALLQGDGTYSVIVGGTNGDYVLRFGSRQVNPATMLVLNTPVVTNIGAGGAPQMYVLSTTPGTGISMTFSASSAGFSFGVQVFDSGGQLVAILGGPTVQTQSLTLCANTDRYELLVSATDPRLQGTLSILAATDTSGLCSGTTVQNAGGPPPTIVPIGSTAQPPSNVCTATSIRDFEINLRRGPSTFFGIAGQLAPHASLLVAGRSSDNNWYASMDNGRTVWIAANLVALNGPCGSLPVIASPPPPFTFTPPPTQTPIIIIVPATPRERRRTPTPMVVTQTPIIITQTPIVVTQTPFVVTATPVPPTATP